MCIRDRAEAARKAKRRVSVSGMLKILGVSRSGYRAWLKHVPSNATSVLILEAQKVLHKEYRTLYVL